jgi:hypothetical protein
MRRDSWRSVPMMKRPSGVLDLLRLLLDLGLVLFIIFL